MKWSPVSRSRQSGRWVLIVRASGVRLYRGSRRKLGSAVEFAADETGYAGLRHYLERAAPSPIHLLVDVIEEDFRPETTPHVVGRGRRAILATRSARLFPRTPFASARREGRVPEGRRDDRVLFSAIVRPERLDPWLDALHGYEVAGVHSLPIASTRLLPLLGAESGPVLLVTASGERDLRQTVFDDGRLVLSRLAPLPPGEPGDRAERIVAEVERLLQHLDRSGRSAGDLRIRLVGDLPLLDLIRKAESPRTRKLSEGLVDAQSVERRLGLRVAGGRNGRRVGWNEGCDRIFARLALSRKVPNHYAPANVLAVRRTKLAGRTLKAAGVVVLLAGATWSGSMWHRSEELAAAAAGFAREADGYEVRYRAERLPDSKVAPHDVRLAVETAQHLDAGRVGALPVLRAMSEALARFPDFTLESLEWSEVSERDGWPHAPDEDALRERFRLIHLRGRIEPFNGHYRAAADEVFRLGEQLEADPRLTEVDVTDVPRDPGGNGHRHRPAARFAMRMVLDVRDD